MSYEEVLGFPDAPQELWEVLWSGGYPRIFHQGVPADDWLRNYVATYVQRDVRQVLNIGDLTGFTTFLRLTAGRTAQERNLSDLGADAGITHNTARSWLSVLQTSFLLFETPPFLRNLRKRLIKAPKLHFLDTGLVCSLLGIHHPDQLVHHPLRGAIFETWVASEIYKARVHRGLPPALFHLRQNRGAEIDCVIEAPERLILVEAKSGATVQSRFFDSMATVAEELSDLDAREVVNRLVYGGDKRQRRTAGEALPWAVVPEVSWE